MLVMSTLQRSKLLHSLRQWKQKAKDRRIQIEQLKKTICALTVSRDLWRKKYFALKSHRSKTSSSQKPTIIFSEIPNPKQPSLPSVEAPRSKQPNMTFVEIPRPTQES